MSHEVFVTGLGMISPAGLTVGATWQALLAGTRCVRPASDLQTGLDAPIVAARVPDFCSRHAPRAVRSGADASETHPVTPPQMYGARSVPATASGRPSSATEGRDRMCQMALAAAREAIGGDVASFRSSVGHLRPAISIGTSKGGIQHFGRFAGQLYEQSRLASSGASALQVLRNPVTTDLLRDIPPDSAARGVAEMIGLPACVHVTVGACTTGTLAVIRGVQLILDGEADLVICGGADASLHPLWLAAFQQMGALASSHPDLGPAWACQPYDRQRRGFAVGEGAGILLLESPRSMQTRGAAPLARVAGYAMATDTAGLTQLTESGDVLAHAIRLACSRAGIEPADLVCLHAHGTGTISNDLTEARAFAAVLAERSGEVPVVSVKGAMGHLLGAAGAVEMALAVLACRHGESFGNATLVQPDPRLGRIHTPREPFAIPRGPVLKTSMGFGGHAAAVVIAPV